MNDVRTERFDAKPVLLLVTVVTITFLARMLLSPLLLQIRAHYGLTHAEGGSLFLVLSVGYSVSVLLSGFVAERLHHRGTVLASAFCGSRCACPDRDRTTIRAVSGGDCARGGWCRALRSFRNRNADRSGAVAALGKGAGSP